MSPVVRGAAWLAQVAPCLVALVAHKSKHREPGATGATKGTEQVNMQPKASRVPIKGPIQPRPLESWTAFSKPFLFPSHGAHTGYGGSKRKKGQSSGPSRGYCAANGGGLGPVGWLGMKERVAWDFGILGFCLGGSRNWGRVSRQTVVPPNTGELCKRDLRKSG